MQGFVEKLQKAKRWNVKIDSERGETFLLVYCQFSYLSSEPSRCTWISGVATERRNTMEGRVL